MRVDGHAEYEKDHDGREQDVQSAAGLRRNRARRRAMGELDAECAIRVDRSGEEDWSEEDQERFDADVD